jgi:hypothetical protein
LPVGGLVILVLCFIQSEIKPGLPLIFRFLDIPGFTIFASAAIVFLLAIEWGGTTYK